MENKSFEFTGKAGEFFLVYIIVMVTNFIPIFGWPFAFNYMTNWIEDNVTIKGEKIKYTATYGESLKFLFINILLVMITLGIYIFWFVPKSYRYIATHTQFANETQNLSQPSAPTPVDYASKSDEVTTQSPPTPPSIPPQSTPPSLVQ